MAITYRYIDWPAGAFNVDLGLGPRLGSITGLVEMAEGGQAGTSSLPFDDTDGTLGYLSDGFTGFKMLVLEEGTAPANNRRVYTGLIGQRQEQSADSLIQGVERRVTPDLRDLNVIAQLRELRGSTWKRPAETAQARMEALLADDAFMGIVDAGLIIYPSHDLEKRDWRGSRPADVLDDIARDLNWEWFIYWSEVDNAPALFFDNANRSDAYASDIRLSNVLADVDSTVQTGVGATSTFAVWQWPVLTRDPERVFSGVSVPWKKGNVHVERASTETAFIARDGVAPTSSPRSRAGATRRANKFLDISDEELDRIACEVDLPTANVNDIRAGQLISAKFRNLRGYADFSWFRVKQRTVSQTMKTDDHFHLALILAPTRPFSCADMTDVNQAHGTVTGYVDQVSGTSLWAHASISGWFGLPVDTAVDTIPVYNPTNANDGNLGTYSYCGQQVLRGTGCVGLYWESTLDGNYLICSTNGTYQYGSTYWRSHQPTSVEYWDGSAWQEAAGSFHLSAPSATPPRWTFTFASPITTSRLRLVYVYCGTAGIMSLWNWNTLGTRLYDWLILGEAA